MTAKLRFLGLDVHAETIAVAIADPDGEVRSLGTIANREIRFASSSGGLIRPSNSAPATKRDRQDSYCTGNWRS
jgi:hypothetical protein